MHLFFFWIFFNGFKYNYNENIIIKILKTMNY